MGVKGLTKFVEADPRLTRPHKLHDCTVVVDGNNLMNFLFTFYKINCTCGGDYKTFASKIKTYFTPFNECNIKPIIVLDGGKGKTDRFFPTQLERWRQRIKRVEVANVTGECDESILPINAMNVFKSMLMELQIQFWTCEYNSGAQIAALANHFNCPVVSSDGDFYIFDVKQGYITLSSLDVNIVPAIESNTTQYLSCRIYNINSFLSIYPSLYRNTLPLLASIAGNDYVKYDDLKQLSYHIYPSPGQKIEQILKWLNYRKYTEAVKDLLSYIPKEQREIFEILLQHSVTSYYIDASDFSYLFCKNTVLKNEKTILNSKLVTYCGMPFPKEYILRHNRGDLASCFLEVMDSHRYFLSPQVGDLTGQNCHGCSRFIRQVLYGILFQHETRNMHVHELICIRDVEEYGTQTGMEEFIKIKPLFVLPSGKPVPKLHEVVQINEVSRLEFLVEVMGVKVSYLNTIPTSLQLLFGGINYWLINCSPKPIKEFVVAILLCIIQFDVLYDHKLKFSNFKTEINTDLIKIYSLLDEIEKSDGLNSFKIVEKNSRTPVCKWRYCFDASIIHSYNQLQTCLKFITLLNSLLFSPLKTISFSKIFEGTVLYNTTQELLLNPETGLFNDLLMFTDSPIYQLSTILLGKILQNIPADFHWGISAFRQDKLKKTDFSH